MDDAVVAGYLGYHPSALLAYALPLLALSPVILLLVALAAEGALAHATREAIRLACAWAALNACGSLVVKHRDAPLPGVDGN